MLEPLPFDAAAGSRTVTARADHLACANATRSEIVVPVLARSGRAIGVLDAVSNSPGAFDAEDQQALETIAALLGARYDRAGDESPWRA